MVFYVSVASHGVGDIVFGELLEEHIEGFAEDVGENGEATAVSHAHDEFFDAELGGELDHGVEGGDHGFAAFEGEAFLADEFSVEEFLEEFGLVEATQDAGFFVLGEGGGVFAAFHAGLKPFAGVVVLHVHELHANVAAVGALKGRVDGAKLFLAAPLKVGQSKRVIEIAIA